MRRGSLAGFVLIVAAAAAFFRPLAGAVNAARPTQTITVLALVLALSAVGIAWLVIRPRRYIRPIYLAVAALAGAAVALLLIPLIHDFDPAPREQLTARLSIVALFNAAGVLLLVMGMRRVLPRRARGFGYAAVVLLMASLYPGPAMILQPATASLNIADATTQLRAGFLFWTVGAVLLVGPFLALTTLPGDWFEDWFDRVSESVMSVPARAFGAGLLLFTFALSVFLTWYSFDARPTTADEIAQLWHARILLSGRLALPADPNPEFFVVDNIVDRPVWMSQFPIGGPAIMALGVLAHAAWLLNPILTALTSWNVYRFCRRAYDEAQARAAAVVVSLSPMMALMGATYMNHTPTAWLVTTALASLPVWVGVADLAAQRRAAAVIGVAIGAALTIRPLDGVIAAALFGVVMLAVAARDRTRARSLLVAIAAGAVPVALLLIANWRTTGSPTRFGYEMLWGANHSLGLHDDPTGHPHTAWRALLLGVKYAAQTNWIATSWPVPVTLVAALGLTFSRRAARWDVLLYAMFGAQVVAYAFYWHDGQFIGPRFLFTAIPALLVLAARAPFLASARLRRGTAAWRIAILIIPVCLAVTWLRRMAPFGAQAVAHEFRESRARLKVDAPREIENGSVQNALVFVQEGAATRLVHRLWGLGVSRPDAARLISDADACSLLEATRAEELRGTADSALRIDRIRGAVRPFQAGAVRVRVPDPNFRISDTTSITPLCRNEILFDMRIRNTIAYGGMLLLNEIEPDGQVGGPAVYVMNLGDRNESLRGRFADRHWYRYELPMSRNDALPTLVPYDSR